MGGCEMVLNIGLLRSTYKTGQILRPDEEVQSIESKRPAAPPV